MKRVDDMSLLEMQRYLERLDRLKHGVGRAYRLLWPLNGWVPFSPVRLVFDLQVLATWFFVGYWLLARPYSERTALLTLGQAWVAALLVLVVVGLIERHLRIKSRFHRLSRERGPTIPPPPPKGADPFYYYGREFFRRVFR